MHTNKVWKHFDVGPIHMSLFPTSSILMVLIKKSMKKRDFSSQLWHIYIVYTFMYNLKEKWRSTDENLKLVYFEIKLGFMVYMMNWWWRKVGVSVKFESRNPPILLRHVNSLSRWNFNAYKYSLKTFQHWPHSHVIVARL